VIWDEDGSPFLDDPRVATSSGRQRSRCGLNWNKHPVEELLLKQFMIVSCNKKAGPKDLGIVGHGEAKRYVGF
jgi:hypothetical protein